MGRGLREGEDHGNAYADAWRLIKLATPAKYIGVKEMNTVVSADLFDSIPGPLIPFLPVPLIDRVPRTDLDRLRSRRAVKASQGPGADLVACCQVYSSMSMACMLSLPRTGFSYPTRGEK
jgi:hypothetical protein